MIEPDSAAALVVKKMEAVREDLLEERRKRDRERTMFRVGLAAHIAVGVIMVFVLLDNRQTLDQQRTDNLNASIAVGTCHKENAPDLYRCAYVRFASLTVDGR